VVFAFGFALFCLSLSLSLSLSLIPFPLFWGLQQRPQIEGLAKSSSAQIVTKFAQKHTENAKNINQPLQSTKSFWGF